MAKLTYNGITLELSDTKSVSRRSVYSEDTNTYLYTHWTFNVLARLNPGATTSLAGVAMPATTDIAIRNSLMQPRKTLTYVDEAAQGGVTILTCPAAGYDCDVRGGPYPRDFRIVQVIGIRTWDVMYVVECFTNEIANQNPGNPNNNPSNICLDHHWIQSVDHDEDQFSTRVIRGVAVFNMAIMRKLGRVPDDFRRDFFHPVPTNFKRTAANVQADPDGCTVRYTVVDTEQPVNLNVLEVSRFEAYHTSWSSKPSSLDGVYRSARHLGNAVFEGFTGSPLAAAKGFAHNMMNEADGQLPQYYSHCIAKAHGTRNTTRKTLQDFCFQICAGRLDFLGLMSLNAYAGIEISITHALHQKMAEVQATIRHGPNPVTYRKVAAMYNDFPDYDDVKNPDGGVLANAGDGNNPPFLNSNQTRGTWLGRVVAQSLKSQESAPAAPANSVVQEQTFR